MTRKCGDCPPWTQTVCRHAFGKYWADKSSGGEGCDHPLDGVAEAWRKAGWTPDAPNRAENAHVSVSAGGGAISLAVSADAPEGRSRAPGAIPPETPRRPSRPTAKKIQSGAPARPKVSAETMRQAELFFRGLK